MSVNDDPFDPAYVDEADTRNELTRVFDVCHACQQCVELCASFPTLFELIDRHEDREAGRLTPVQQDRVVDACFQCTRCVVDCPYAPGRDPAAIDVPRLMLRAVAMRRANGQLHGSARRGTVLLGRTDRVGRLATAMPTLANRIVGAPPRSLVRKALRATTGVSAVRLLPPYARQRFSTWFGKRPKVRLARRQGSVAIFPTCLVEYQDPGIGQDLVKVYERNGIECALTPDVRCCGAPWLHNGEATRFAEVATANVAALAEVVRSGRDVVVPQPTCGYVIKRDYPRYVPGPDAALVAEHTFDACEYLMKVHKSDETVLDTEFPGEVPATITYHVPCHLRAQEVGLKSRDLLKLTGSRITLAEQCSGIDGMWGLRASHEAISKTVAARLGDEVRQAASEVVAGDCHLANVAIAEETGATARHPLQVLARAYGIPVEG